MRADPSTLDARAEALVEAPAAVGRRNAEATTTVVGPPPRGVAKVLFVIGTLQIGGTERQLVELARRLDRSRFEPVVCCLAAEGPLSAPLRAAGIRVECLGIGGVRQRRGLSRLRHLLKLPADLVRLVGFFRREAPDVVHGLLFHAYVAGALIGRLTGAPIVVASRRSLARFKDGKRHYWIVERWANRLTDLVIANSGAVREETLRLEALPPDKVVVIPNGIDLTRFDGVPDAALRSALALSPGPLAIVVANFIHYKGYEYFIDAWAQVCRRVPSATALLVGDGPVRRSCESRVAALGIDPHVRFLGSRQDVPALLGLADLAVHPSLEEGFSNAVLEAMAAGRPVVATAVGGTPEAIVEGESGLLVPPRDADVLARAIERLLTDTALRERMGRAARRRVAERFTVESMVRRYERVYDELREAQYAVAATGR